MWLGGLGVLERAWGGFGLGLAVEVLDSWYLSFVEHRLKGILYLG